MLPTTIDELRKCIKRAKEPNCQVFKHATDTHHSTNYDKWWGSTSPERIKCFTSLRRGPHLACSPRLHPRHPRGHAGRYEPYLVVRKEGTPLFDERFVGYGKNKIQWIQHLRLRGFTFHVMPKVFVVHCPHEESAARHSWEAFRGKKDKLFQDFIQAQTLNASINTRMCKHVNWGVLHAVESDGTGVKAQTQGSDSESEVAAKEETASSRESSEPKQDRSSKGNKASQVSKHSEQDSGPKRKHGPDDGLGGMGGMAGGLRALASKVNSPPSLLSQDQDLGVQYPPPPQGWCTLTLERCSS